MTKASEHPTIILEYLYTLYTLSCSRYIRPIEHRLAAAFSIACARCVGFFRGGRRAFSHTHGTWRCKLHMRHGRQWIALVGGSTLASARTRMRMTAPDLYREARRNAPRRVAVLGARHRVRLPSMVDTEIGARLYGDMCTIGSWVRHRLACGDG